MSDSWYSAAHGRTSSGVGTAVLTRPRATLDAGGESAATLRGSLDRCMAGIEPGDIMEVISGDPSGRVQIPRWCGLTGHELIGEAESEHDTIYWIRKARAENGHRRRRQVPLALADIDDDDAAAVTAVLDTGRLSSGPRVEELEKQFARRLGMKHAVAVTSGAAALHLALDAIELRSEHEVIIPTLSFAATAAAVRHCGATPVLVDVHPDSLCMDPLAVEAAITPRTRAIVPVHVGGQAPAMDDIIAVADTYKLVVIEDTAHAFPASYRGRDLGTIGHCGVFSFDTTKNLICGEGGILVTENDHLAERATAMSLHGMRHVGRLSSARSWEYEIVAPGFGYGMTEMAAAFALSQLRKVDRMWGRRQAIATRYSVAFGGYSQLDIPTVAPSITHSWHLYMLRLNLEQLPIGRDAVIDELAARDVEASVYFTPVHTLSYYQQALKYRNQQFPVASREWGRIISLPIYSGMKDRDVDHVIDAVVDIIEKHAIA